MVSASRIPASVIGRASQLTAAPASNARLTRALASLSAPRGAPTSRPHPVCPISCLSASTAWRVHAETTHARRTFSSSSDAQPTASSSSSSSSWNPPPDRTSRSFAVIGAGTLGRRIALMWLTQGRDVYLFDRNQAALEDAQAFIERELPGAVRDLVQDGKPGKLVTTGDLAEAVRDAWLVTEAIPEIKGIKVELLGELDEVMREDAVLATNSSSFMASEVWERVSEHGRRRMVNMHYYMPPKDRAVEIMPTRVTDSRIAGMLKEESLLHGLIPFLAKKESVGLIANRIWAAIKRESLLVVAEGVADPADVDGLMVAISNFTQHPFTTMDRVGLDVVLDIEKHYLEVRKDLSDDAAKWLERKIKESPGDLGMKTGKGFYDYGGRQ